MFETPIDLTEIRSVLTDAGHTAVGFATLAAKKGNEIRLDASKKYESQISGFRAQAIALANRADATASELEDRFVPVVTKLTDRLPGPVGKVAHDLADQGKALRHEAHKLVVKVLSSDVVSAAPTASASAAKSAARSTAAPKAAAKAAKPAAAKATKVATAKVTKVATAAKSATKAAKPVAGRSVAKAARVTTTAKATKPVAKTAARKPRAPKVATA